MFGFDIYRPWHHGKGGKGERDTETDESCWCVLEEEKVNHDPLLGQS